MADPEQTPQEAEGPKSSPPADGARSSGKTKSDSAGPSEPNRPIKPQLPAVSPPPTSSPPPTAQSGPPTPPTPLAPTLAKVPKHRFWVNLVLFVVLAGNVAFWFWKHMEHLFTEVLIGGGVLAAMWLAVQFMFHVLKFAVEEKMKALPMALLNRRGTWAVLVLLVIVSVGLNTFTSSLFVEYTTDDPAVKKVTAEVFNAATGQRFIQPLTVTSVDKVAGKLFFFHLHSMALKFNLMEPRGHQP